MKNYSNAEGSEVKELSMPAIMGLGVLCIVVAGLITWGSIRLIENGMSK